MHMLYLFLAARLFSRVTVCSLLPGADFYMMDIYIHIHKQHIYICIYNIYIYNLQSS